ncbi:MAG TPA: histidine phosphatase family protein [Anaerolineaceae bacterium]|jgi:probable phosphoglycerate mutase
MNRVYWVRHGENRANLTKEFSYKRIDYPLTPKGIFQAEQTADYFAEQSVDAVFSSPLKRAQQTAGMIGARLGLPVTVIEELREINVGNLEGGVPTPENWNTHDRILISWWRGERELAFPDGENGFELIERVQTGLNRILTGREDQNLIVVSHIGCLLMSLAGLVPAVQNGWLTAHGFGNCAFTEFLFEQRAGRISGQVSRWGVSGHLSGFASRQEHLVSLVHGVDISPDRPIGMAEKTV